MTLKTGILINSRYRIAKLIGQGGFGAVYRAWDTNLNRPCALKENLDISQEAQRQFEREAKILAGLIHPHLPRVTDHFVVPGQGQYLIMDFVEGEDLASLIARGEQVTEEQALTWISQVAEALVYLHGQPHPVIHRDIKPANIRITPQKQAMLVDFGLVKVYDEHLKTTIGARAITPGYSPPEQYSLGITDHRTDIYALAATLYTLLTCQTPPESVRRVVGEAMTPAHIVNPQISHHTAIALEQAMALNPSQRFQSAEEFLAALYFPGRSQKIGEPHVPPATQKTVSRRIAWPLIGLGGVGLLLLVMVIFALVLVSGQTPTITVTVTENLVALIEDTKTLTATTTTTATPSPTATVLDLTTLYQFTVVESAGGFRWQDGLRNLLPTTGEQLEINSAQAVLMTADAEPTELILSDGGRLFLGANTEIIITPTEDPLIMVEIQTGTLVWQAGSLPVMVRTPFGMAAQWEQGLAGVHYTETPLKFELSCFVGSCLLQGDLGGQLLLLAGESGFVSSSGQPQADDDTLYAPYFFARLVPTATIAATRMVANTLTYTPTPTPTRTRPRNTPTFTPIATLVPPTPVPPTSEPPTSAPPTAVPSTPVPPTNTPSPTDVPTVHPTQEPTSYPYP
ncbi:MAG: serine/threonine protein kinase [Chloroflexi bacterium]|nr:serine/threonine protein kinase [Chloroflexota bacterium]MBP8059213.1 serine/threonine protein kinase [Chloroflexota bacterium]